MSACILFPYVYSNSGRWSSMLLLKQRCGIHHIKSNIPPKSASVAHNSPFICLLCVTDAAPLVASSFCCSMARYISWSVTCSITKWSCPSPCRRACGALPIRPPLTGPASRCWWTRLFRACSPLGVNPQFSVSPLRRSFVSRCYFRFLSVRTCKAEASVLTAALWPPLFFLAPASRP